MDKRRARIQLYQRPASFEAHRAVTGAQKFFDVNEGTALLLAELGIQSPEVGFEIDVFEAMRPRAVYARQCAHHVRGCSPLRYLIQGIVFRLSFLSVK